jgi:hypothetical protein
VARSLCPPQQPLLQFLSRQHPRNELPLPRQTKDLPVQRLDAGRPMNTFGVHNIILMYIEFGMAQKYVGDLSRNVKNGLKTKVQNSWYPGVAPGGYW